MKLRTLPLLMALAGMGLGLILVWSLFPEVDGRIDPGSYQIFEIDWLETRWAYAYLMGASLFFPLILSFDRRVSFVGSWRYLLAPLLLVSVPYILWDVYFTEAGVWAFQDEYLLGIRWWGLPIEEISFFVVIPFACVFIYECVQAYFLVDFMGKAARWVGRGILAVMIFVGLGQWGHQYSFGAAWVLLGAIVFLEKGVEKRGRGEMYLTVLISYLPFFMINGCLTGMCTEMPIVRYNMTENLGFRALSIPWDDFIYQGGYLLWTLLVYEWIKGEKK